MGAVVDESRFFQRLALVLFVLTLLAFSTTYLLPVVTGRFVGPPILHIHGMLFLAWPALFLAQTHSIARSRRWHRNLGLAGISLATAMVLMGLLAIGSSIRTWAERGVGLEGQAISIIAFSGLLMFAGFFVAAIAKTRDKAAHSRLMALATLSIMQATSGRLLLTLVLGGNREMLRPGLLPPVDLTLTIVPHLSFDVAIIAWLLFHDRQALGKPHKVTIIGSVIVLLVHGARHLFVETSAWKSVAQFLTGL